MQMRKLCFARHAAAVAIISIGVEGCSVKRISPAVEPPGEDRITSSEITAARAQSALELLQRFRPEFGKQRQTNSAASVPAVYVDGVRLAGGLQRLEEIHPDEVCQIRVLRSWVAAQRLGSDLVHEALIIERRHRSPCPM
jgi:hypothetical protein